MEVKYGGGACDEHAGEENGGSGCCSHRRRRRGRRESYPLRLWPLFRSACALPARLVGGAPLPRNANRPISIVGLPPRGRLAWRRARASLSMRHGSRPRPSPLGLHQFGLGRGPTTTEPADRASPRRATPPPPPPRRHGEAIRRQEAAVLHQILLLLVLLQAESLRAPPTIPPQVPKQDIAARALLASPSDASPSATQPTAAAGQTAQPLPPLSGLAGPVGSVSGKASKKKVGSRLWMRLDRWGASEIVELDKASIIRRAGVPQRDLRILGPVFSQSSSILAREKAMVINLEFIRAIVTAEEVLLLDPLSHEVLPFVDQLRQHLPLKSLVGENGKCVPDCNGEKQDGSPGGQVPCLNEATGAEHELPFEFQVLEVALEIVCSLLDLNVAVLERHATPVLDELTRNASTRNLEQVRNLKTNLTRLLARVQKVRDEIEHLLDDNEDMEHLYLTRKQVQNQQVEALLSSAASNSIVPAGTGVPRLNSSFRRSVSIATSMHLDNDVEDLEMLLEAYFMQLDGIRNRILSVREYIDDTEDYVNIQLDNQRNELIQLQLILTIASFGIAANTYIAGAFAMNIQTSLYNTDGSLFWPFVGGTSSGCFVIFLLLLGYAWWKKLLGP